MGLYGSPPPPPPPDYSAQKAQIARETEARYAQQAAEYNAAVNNYNSALSGYQGDLNALSSNVGGMSIADLYDDPNTEENENPFSSYMSNLNTVSSGLGGLSLGVERPVFQSTIQTPYGPTGVSNIPSLSSANQNLYNQLMGTTTSLTGTLNDLQNRRRQEEQRVSDFRNNLMADLSNYQTGVGQLSIADEAQMNQLERDIAALDARRQGFSSSIMSQLFPNQFEGIASGVGGIRSSISDLRSQRQAELDRIAAFERDILGNVDAYRDTLGGLTIADENQIGSLQQQIDDIQTRAGRFSSELGFDFNDELGELGGLERELGNLRSQREQEIARIQRMQDQYLNTARALEQSAEGADIYSAAGLDAIGDRLRDVRQDISGFSSLLPFDFSGSEASLSEADAALAALRERRAQEIAGIESRISPLVGGLNDIALSDEQAMRDRIAELRGIEGDLARFSGGRVGEVQGQISSGVEAVNSRLAELQDYRSQLEERAQGLLEQVRNASYFQTGDLGSDQETFNAIQAEAELYNAQQAMDEVDAIMNRLNSERQRLEADAEAVAARRNQSASQLLGSLGPGGVPRFRDFSQTDPMTIEEYLARFVNTEEEEPLLGLSPSAFSNALGVIRIGG